MNKLRIMMLMLFGVCAFGALAVSMASAAELAAEWLWNMVGIAAGVELPVLASGELELMDTEAPIVGLAVVLCSGILDGTVLAAGDGLIEELLALNELELISRTGLTGVALACTNSLNCPTPLVWAINLKWHTFLTLITVGTEEFFAILLLEEGTNGKPGWEVQCMGEIGEPSDTCTAEAEGVAEAKNEGTGVDATFSQAFTELVGVKLAKCSGGRETGIVAGLGLIEDTGGGTLAVSSP
jgi:hypothetical protein